MTRFFTNNLTNIVYIRQGFCLVIISKLIGISTKINKNSLFRLYLRGNLDYVKNKFNTKFSSTRKLSLSI